VETLKFQNPILCTL